MSNAAPEDMLVVTTPRAAMLFNPFDPIVNANPYPHYERLRRCDPVHRSRLGVWFVGRYEDVRAALKDRRFRVRDTSDIVVGQTVTQPVAERAISLDRLTQGTSSWLIFQEGSNHKRLKGVYTGAMSRGFVEALRPTIRTAACLLVSEQLPRGEMDVMKDFARLLPFQVVAQMIGLPSEMFPAIQSWARLLTRFVVSFTSLEDLLLLDVASGEFADYLRTIIADRRVAPKKDLISSLIEDKGAQGQVLTEQELLSICIFVVVAGLEAVENFLGNSALALITHPNEWQRFRERGGNWTTAIDELLRFDAPLQLVLRKALEDVELGGKIIRAGEYVYLALGSANRDSARFERADELLLDRQQNHHLSFGDGHHLCVGAQLSRIEGHESLQVLMEMIPDMRPATDKLTWGRSLLAHGLKALPVKFTAQRDSNYAAVN